MKIRVLSELVSLYLIAVIKSCSNCFDYAMAWRSNVMRAIRAEAPDAGEAEA